MAAACDRSKLLPVRPMAEAGRSSLAFLPAFPWDKVPLSRRPGNRTIDGKVGGNMESRRLLSTSRTFYLLGLGHQRSTSARVTSTGQGPSRRIVTLEYNRVILAHPQNPRIAPPA